MKTTLLLILTNLMCFYTLVNAQEYSASEPVAEAGYDRVPTEENAGSRQKTSLARKVYNLDFAAGQQLARFDNLAEYIDRHLEYPESARVAGVEGTVKVLVTISPEGEVQLPKIVQSLGHGCDEAALDLVRKMPAWVPAMNHGIPVKGKKTLEIAFKLQ
ncbi:MAG TPA: energy transducer TonB [Flavilitoribacter sp.]|nr:energy transducer TonB [Flavilitoribacter sp.]HMQ87605.1 energy transducer TonB [Flavilitoribacter sp.]